MAKPHGLSFSPISCIALGLWPLLTRTPPPLRPTLCIHSFIQARKLCTRVDDFACSHGVAPTCLSWLYSHNTSLHGYNPNEMDDIVPPWMAHCYEFWLALLFWAILQNLQIKPNIYVVYVDDIARSISKNYRSGCIHQNLDDCVRGWMKHVISSTYSFITAMIVAIPALLKIRRNRSNLIALMLLDGAAISYIKEHAGHVHRDEYHPRGWPSAMTKEWAEWENNAFCASRTK